MFHWIYSKKNYWNTNIFENFFRVFSFSFLFFFLFSFFFNDICQFPETLHKYPDFCTGRGKVLWITGSCPYSRSLPIHYIDVVKEKGLGSIQLGINIVARMVWTQVKGDVRQPWRLQLLVSILRFPSTGCSRPRLMSPVKLYFLFITKKWKMEWICVFLEDISAKWNSNSIVQEFELGSPKLFSALINVMVPAT